MTRWDAESAVVGLGAWGAAALWRLASRGVDVIGFERFTPAHALGSSHGGSRMIRLARPEHPGLVPLARRSRELWEELADTGREHGPGRESLFTACGGLVIGPENGRVAGGTLGAAHEHGIPVRTFTASALRFRYPRHTGIPSHHIGVWEPSAGLVRPEHALRAMLTLAEQAGARVRSDSRITRLEPIPGGIRLHTAQGSTTARQVVLTAGAWLPALLPGLALQTFRMPLTWYRPLEADGDFDLEYFPLFQRELDDGLVLWGSGVTAGNDVCVSLYDGAGAGKQFDPEDTDRSVGAEDWSHLERLLPAKVPGLETQPARVAVSTRTRTPDGLYTLGRPGGDPHVIIAGGAGAHGLAQAPGIGEALADLVQGEPMSMPLDFLSPDRFN
ncbi:N-methyl-L-tryptophan oxidase [Streptomyces sp. NPDC056479]|uniref:N-methyl-L-tryptophan oxidase n=1 Tax=Streptomyces sp. NPDC056479 TaxID=3345832 RepID=UPI0036A9E042